MAQLYAANHLPRFLMDFACLLNIAMDKCIYSNVLVHEIESLNFINIKWFLCCAVVCADEIDSYMYQSVGHHAIELYAEAMGLPLYRRSISGSALMTDRDYSRHPDDEVEDLFLLLQDIQVV